MMKEFLNRLPAYEEERVMEIRDKSDEVYAQKKDELSTSSDPYKM